MKLRATLAAGVLAASTVAFGVAGLGSVGAADDTIDAYKGLSNGVVDTTAIGTLTPDYETSRASGMEAVVELEVGEATDMQFQRRPVTRVVDGVEVTETLDLAFVGISDINNSFNGFTILDITDPTNPTSLIDSPDGRIECGEFHNDIGVWRNYMVLGWDGGGGTCPLAEAKWFSPVDPNNADGSAGIYVFDVTDPANPDPVRFFNAEGEGGEDLLRDGTHNFGIHPDGYVYFATASFDADNPGFGYVDLNGEPETWEQVVFPMRDISVGATDGCHDMGFNFEVESPQLVCPAIGTTLLWDITDPTAPVELANIPNPAINIHHGGRFTPDGSTVVLGDELAGAGGSAYGLFTGTPGGTGGKGGAPVGSLFTYDLTVPEAPVPTGYASASENLVDGPPDSGVVTSHFYNFVPNAEHAVKVVTGWYSSGMVVHDLTGVADTPVTAAAPEVAHIEPTGAEMWNAYAYRGHVFGGSYTGNTGFFVATLDGYTGTPDAELAPYCNDVGIVWGPWTTDWRSECISPNDDA